MIEAKGDEKGQSHVSASTAPTVNQCLSLGWRWPLIKDFVTFFEKANQTCIKIGESLHILGKLATDDFWCEGTKEFDVVFTNISFQLFYPLIDTSRKFLQTYVIHNGFRSGVCRMHYRGDLSLVENVFVAQIRFARFFLLETMLGKPSVDFFCQDSQKIDVLKVLIVKTFKFKIGNGLKLGNG